MNECCNTGNPLHRDGTSQAQRFPLALDENYVRIDERGPAQLLNFTREFAKEIRFYNIENQYQSLPGWDVFFNNDISFILAHNLLIDLEIYRRGFTEAWDKLPAEIEELESLRAALTPDTVAIDAQEDIVDGLFKDLFAYFLRPGGLLPDGIAPMSLLLSNWAKQLPDSSLFNDELSYSFKDLVLDGLARLGKFMRQLVVVNFEFNPDLGGEDNRPDWEHLLDEGWALGTLPSSTNGDFSKTEQLVALDLLKATQLAFLGTIESMQMQVSMYLIQSFEKYPRHQPQNALFLAFIRLFSYAQAHLNTLGRRHLLYHYQDVLRFSPRPLTPDQAAVVVELRKGTPVHVLKEGTLLKAGKDAKGKDRFFEVQQETAINQAKLEQVKTLFVERQAVNPNPPQSPPTPPVLKGIFGSPVGNSADGLGAPLEKALPKWNMFGEAQTTLATRTMPDARLGLAVASPIFYMREGRRSITLSFKLSVPANRLLNKAARFQSEATLRHALSVQFTHAKGWEAAEIRNVFWVHSSAAQIVEIPFLGNYLDDATLPIGPPAASITNTSTTLIPALLVVCVYLPESAVAMLPYSEKIHAMMLETVWPTLQMVFPFSGTNYGSTDLTKNLLSNSAPKGLQPFVAGTSVAAGELRLFGGVVYKSTINGTKADLSKFTAIGSLDEILTTLFPTYDLNRPYQSAGVPTGVPNFKVVYFEGAAYRVEGTALANQSPASHPDKWKRLDFSGDVYPMLEGLKMEKVFLKAEGAEISGFSLENDLGRLKANKPFQPFGPVPVKGSKFVVGSKEIFGKKLDQLNVSITWLDPPKDLAKHYGAYAGSVPNGERSRVELTESTQAENEVQFRNAASGGSNPVKVYNYVFDNAVWRGSFNLLEKGQWNSIGIRPLFHPVVKTGSVVTGDASYTQRLDFTSAELAASFQDLDLREVSLLESNSNQGFLRIELSNPSMAFGHKAYRDLYVNAATAIATEIAADPPPTVIVTQYPNEPYTPVIKELRIGYVTRAQIDFGKKAGTKANFEGRISKMFHLHPFGHVEVHPCLLLDDENQQLLPYFPDEGHLYLGFSALAPPTTLSVMFQLLEGSGAPDLNAGDTKWSVLSNNRWRDLASRDILIDTTGSLITSGVIRFQLSELMTLGNTLLDGGLRWLRVKTSNGSAAFLKVIDILPQAVLVSFADQGNDTSHLAKALPSGSITALKITDSHVKGISQPYSSFGGKLPEQDNGYVTRVSERLRHRQRAVNIFDYEHLVLEQFPSIYKVKCINHSELNSVTNSGMDWEISPGHVTVVCIPDLRNRNASNPFEPKTSLRILNQVTDYLKGYSSAWATIKAANPLYEQVKVKCQIIFTKGKDPGYYASELEVAIQRYLSPWAFEGSTDISFGNGISRSHLINLIEQQDYVDHVLQFKVEHIVDGNALPVADQIKPTKARSILVSSVHHEIISLVGCPECASNSTQIPPPESPCCAHCGNCGTDSSTQTKQLQISNAIHSSSPSTGFSTF